MPFLSHDADEENIELSSSPFRINPFRRGSDNSKLRKASDASSEMSRQPFRRRVVRGAVDLLTQYDLSHPVNYSRVTPSPVPGGSAQSLREPGNVKQKAVHLGWSDMAKSTFDRVVSPTSSAPKVEPPLITHVAAPARPLDETKVGLRGVESPQRKNSIFGTFLDSWKESKAERRREELKKLIRFVPYGEENVGNVKSKRRSSTLGWM